MKKNITILAFSAIIGISANLLQPVQVLAQAKKSSKAPQPTEKKETPPQETTIHLIQLAAYKGTPTGDYSKLAKLGSVYSEKNDKGLNRIVLGDFKTPEEAQKALKTTHELGFKEAFLITKKTKPETSANKKDDKKIAVADKKEDKKEDKKIAVADKSADKKEDKKVAVADKSADKKEDKKIAVADKSADKKEDKKIAVADKKEDKKEDKKNDLAIQPIFIQLGAFKEVELEQFKNVTELGNLYLDTDKEGFSKIRLGKFTDPEQARKTLIEVRKRGYPKAFLILAPLPPAAEAKK